MKFSQYPLSSEVKNNLSRLKFQRPTDIQYKSIPSILNGEDVLAIAQTGTGKTAAFAIPLVDRIHRQKSSRRTSGIQCLVMEPTRELARQIGDVFNSLARHTRVKVFSLHGGVEQDPQIARLQDGLDILIATPGRMFDLISQGHIRLDAVNTLVLDEADHMLDLGFIKDIESVKKKLSQNHQTLFFSATINKRIKKLAFSQVKSTAIRIQISPEDPVSKNVTHFVMFVKMDDKRFFLEQFVHDHPGRKILVFVRTRVRADRVVKAMDRLNIDAIAIHGDKEQTDRNRVMEAFKSGEERLLIATDISARGIDIPHVDYVVNYDLPEKAENYVHRVGRTGRGTRKGVAVAFCSPEERERLDEIQAYIGKPIEEIKVGKQDYAMTARPKSTLDDLRAMIDEHETWEKKRKKRKK